MPATPQRGARYTRRQRHATHQLTSLSPPHDNTTHAHVHRPAALLHHSKHLQSRPAMGVDLITRAFASQRWGEADRTIGAHERFLHSTGKLVRVREACRRRRNAALVDARILAPLERAREVGIHLRVAARESGSSEERSTWPDEHCPNWSTFGHANGSLRLLRRVACPLCCVRRCWRACRCTDAHGQRLGIAHGRRQRLSDKRSVSTGRTRQGSSKTRTCLFRRARSRRRL